VRSIPILQAGDIVDLLPYRDAARAIGDALRAGLDPAADPARQVLDVRSGQLLLMPSESATAVGVKAVTLAPGNAALGLPRIHGAYLMYTAGTLELIGIMDGAMLSTLRTPAVSMAGIAPAFTSDRFGGRPVRVLIYGAGPQAVGHAEALATGGFCKVADITYVVRNVERAQRDLHPGAHVLRAGDPAVTEHLRTSDVVVCTTTSTTPLFASEDIGDRAVIAIVGAHEATWRETEGALLARSTVVVEDRATALREAGDIVFAIREGHLTGDELVPMADVIRGAVVPDPKRPYAFKSVGMSWEDLVVAEAVMRRYAETGMEAGVEAGAGT
jgi:ornithine cyclodeaminase/alanine dehydrogenase-like protein (mu-crystallin family)